MIQQGWHFRDLDTTAEYGIDQEVEIFGDGQATGLTFRVQVKGAGKPDNIGPYRDIKLETFNYWRNLDTPVLLVLWVESTDTLYGRWVHSYDFGPKPKGKKYHRVRFTELDRLTTRVQTIRDEVEVIRILGRGGVPRPLPLAVIVEPQDRQPALIYSFNQFLFTHGLRPYIRLVEPHPAAWTARVLTDRVRVEQPSNNGSETHWGLQNYSTSAPAASIISDILISLGILISKLGATSDAVRLFRSSDLSAVSMEIPLTAIQFAEIASYEGAVDLIYSKVLELLPRFNEPLVSDMFDGFWFTLFGMAAALSKDDVKGLRKQAKRVIAKAEQDGRQGDGARLANNVSAIMKVAGAHHRVEEFLDMAARLDPPAYASRAETFLSRGNARWHLGDLGGAVEAYTAARAAGLADTHIVPPLSDALFDSGRFREALELLREWFEHEEGIDARSILRYLILKEIVEGLGIDTQERRYDPEAFLRVQDADQESVRQAQVESDALDLDLWSLRHEEDAPLLAKWALFAFRTDSPHAWITTLVLAKFLGTNERHTSILIDGAIEAVELVDSASELKRTSEAGEIAHFLDELVLKAYAYERPALEKGRINLVDVSNKIVATLVFDEEGDVIKVEGEGSSESL